MLMFTRIVSTPKYGANIEQTLYPFYRLKLDSLKTRLKLWDEEA